MLNTDVERRGIKSHKNVGNYNFFQINDTRETPSRKEKKFTSRFGSVKEASESRYFLSFYESLKMCLPISCRKFQNNGPVFLFKAIFRH